MFEAIVLENQKTDIIKVFVVLIGRRSLSRHFMEKLRKMPDMEELRDRADIHYDDQEAFEFLKQVENFERCGILCRIPDWWKKKSSRPSLKISFGTKEPALVGINALINVEAGLFIGDDPISPEEVEELLSQSQGLALIKNRWIEVDTQRLDSLLCAYKAAMDMAGDQGLTIKEALRLKLNPERLSAIENLTDLEISNGEWLEQVVSKLKRPELVTKTKSGRGFLAKLRPYQQRGLNWLAFLDTLGFGACLADDMGLGKTVQVLAFLSTLRTKESDRTSLLVVPASLLSNWEAEISRFLPDLKYFMAHPGYEKESRSKQRTKIQWESFDLVITTYAMVQRHGWMQDVPWRVLILDEAQAIKNPSTKQSKIVKKLRSDTRVTMTGTPIENSLPDLWSLFDFFNPGLMGSLTEFKAFSKELNTDPSGYGRLKQVVSPYILRRMKTDKKIAPDLPDKVEMRTFPELSKKQRVLYLCFSPSGVSRWKTLFPRLSRKRLPTFLSGPSQKHPDGSSRMPIFRLFLELIWKICRPYPSRK